MVGVSIGDDDYRLSMQLLLTNVIDTVTALW